ncbi:MAG: hypothetical protein INR65_16975, partial [Gluconacetobacter diazotrophicus]|nr:hypothetical protein [Gluconacetobacter diazotrophicus]
YGRWSQFDGRWGWIPMEPDAPPVAVAEPAYAPALVDFLAAGAVAGAVAGFAAGGSIGWVPLGPHEPYRPPYAVGAPYRQHLTFNRVDIDARRTEINQVIEINRYDNRRGFTVMPAAAMARSEAVPHPGPNPSALPAGYRSLRGEAALPPPGAPANRVAAGPRIDPALFRPRDLPASRTPFRDARPPGQQLPPANPAMGHPMAGPIHAVAVPAGGAPVPHPPEAARLDTGPSAPNGLPALRRAGEVPAGAPAGPGRTEHPRPLAQDQRPEAPPHPNPFPASRPAVMPRPPAQAEPAAHGTSGHDGPARGTAGGPPDAPGFRSQSPRPDFPRMEPPHAQPPRAEPFRAEPVRTPGPRDGFRAEPPRQLEHPEPARAQPPRPAPPRPEPPRPEPFRPAPHPPAPPHPPTQARPEPPHGEHRPPG